MADVVRWLAVQDANQVTVSDDEDEDDPAELGGEIRGILRAAVAEGHPHAQHALAQFDRFCELDPRTRSDIYATAQTLVQPWADPCDSHASSLHAGERSRP